MPWIVTPDFLFFFGLRQQNRTRLIPDGAGQLTSPDHYRPYARKKDGEIRYFAVFIIPYFLGLMGKSAEQFSPWVRSDGPSGHSRYFNPKTALKTHSQRFFISSAKPTPIFFLAASATFPSAKSPQSLHFSNFKLIQFSAPNYELSQSLTNSLSACSRSGWLMIFGLFSMNLAYWMIFFVFCKEFSYLKRFQFGQKSDTPGI